MHLILLLSALGISYGLRLQPIQAMGSIQARWQRSLTQFLFAPLLLLMTAIALVCMGPWGQMVRWWEGWLSYSLAVGLLVIAGILLLKLSLQGWRSLRRVCSYPIQEVLGRSGRLLPVNVPFVAQVGFWQPELVLSQGLLDTFDAEHLEVIFTHEQAHHYYRDTFWFFWLGWLRRLTLWLPQTEALWQDLLLLREQRADAWAARQVDTLLLAESLLQMVSAPELYSESFCAAFGSSMLHNRLEERINALLAAPEPQPTTDYLNWLGLGVVLLPLLMVPFHY